MVTKKEQTIKEQHDRKIKGDGSLQLGELNPKPQEPIPKILNSKVEVSGCKASEQTRQHREAEAHFAHFEVFSLYLCRGQLAHLDLYLGDQSHGPLAGLNHTLHTF